MISLFQTIQKVTCWWITRAQIPQSQSVNSKNLSCGLKRLFSQRVGLTSSACQEIILYWSVTLPSSKRDSDKNLEESLDAHSKHWHCFSFISYRNGFLKSVGEFEMFSNSRDFIEKAHWQIFVCIHGWHLINQLSMRVILKKLTDIEEPSKSRWHR
jgi:hypothetical protein